MSLGSGSAGGLSLNTAAGANTAITEAGIDRPSGSNTTFNVTNSDVTGVMTLQVDGLDVLTTATGCTVNGCTMLSAIIFDGVTLDIQAPTDQDIAFGLGGTGKVAIRPQINSAGEHFLALAPNDVDIAKFPLLWANTSATNGEVALETVAYSTSGTSAAANRINGWVSSSQDAAPPGTGPAVIVQAGECTDGRGSTCDALESRALFGVYNNITLSWYLTSAGVTVTPGITSTASYTSSAVSLDFTSGAGEDMVYKPGTTGLSYMASAAQSGVGEQSLWVGPDDVTITTHGTFFTNATVTNSAVEPQLAFYATAAQTVAGRHVAVLDDSQDTGSNTAFTIQAFECTDGRGSTCSAIDTSSVNIFNVLNFTTSLLTLNAGGTLTTLVGGISSATSLTATTGTVTTGANTSLTLGPNGTGTVLVSAQSIEIDEDTTTTPTCAADADVGRITRYSKSAGATISICICNKAASTFANTAIGGGDCT